MADFGGYVQLHVSGLPIDCEDEDVDGRLRRVIAGIQPAHEAVLAKIPEGQVEEEAQECTADATDGQCQEEQAVASKEEEVAQTAVNAETREKQASTPSPAEADAEDSTTAPAEADAEASTPEASKSGPAEADAEASTSAPAESDKAEADRSSDIRPADVEAKADAEVPQEEEYDPDAVQNELREAAAFVSCSVVRNKDTLECKGYCFLTFENATQAEAAYDLLNMEGTIVCGVQLSAQVSQKKDRHESKRAKNTAEDVEDLRLRRARYAAVSKRAQYGHFNVTAQGIADKTKGGSAERNSAGRKTGICGTRGGNSMKAVERTEKEYKRNTGFEACTRKHQ